jgi:ATP-binding cassette, subfamily F, member 3
MIRLEDAHFSFGGKPILDGASVLVPDGARAGLIGRNGAGKTTIFRLILGDLELAAGSLEIARGRRVAFLPQEPDLPAGETILHHVLSSHPVLRDMEDDLLGLEETMASETDPDRLDRAVERHRALSRDFEAGGGYDLEARVAGILEGLGFERADRLREIGRLSPGEKSRVALAKVLLADADLLLLDEPTNHLDFEMVEWFERFLSDPPPGASGAKPTAIVASHDRYFLNRFADRIYELREGRLFSYRGNYDAFALQRAEEAERLEKEWRLRQEDVARELEFIRRNFAGQKARQAKSREKKLSRLEPVEMPVREAGGPRMRFGEMAPPGDHVLRLRDVECGYGTTAILGGVTLELERGERVAILGPNGCGKTTLLRTMAGILPPLGGVLDRGPRTVIGYHGQEVGDEAGGKSVFEEVHDLVPRWTNQEVRDLLAAFAFRGDEIHTRTGSLSGGERARVALIRLILSGPNLLLLDEPTNHLDVYARAALEQGLADYSGTILFVSHDRYFVEQVAGRVFAIEDGRLRERLGGYEEYSRVAAEAKSMRAAEADAARSAAREAARGPRRREAGGSAGGRLRKAEEERLVKTIAKLEEDLEGKRALSGLEEHYRNPDAMRRLKQEIAAIEERLNGLYESWEALLAGGGGTGER